MSDKLKPLPGNDLPITSKRHSQSLHGRLSRQPDVEHIPFDGPLSVDTSTQEEPLDLDELIEYTLGEVDYDGGVIEEVRSQAYVLQRTLRELLLMLIHKGIVNISDLSIILDDCWRFSRSDILVGAGAEEVEEKRARFESLIEGRSK